MSQTDLEEIERAVKTKQQLQGEQRRHGGDSAGHGHHTGGQRAPRRLVSGKGGDGPTARGAGRYLVLPLLI